MSGVPAASKLLLRGAIEVFSRKELEIRLSKKPSLCVKLGVDPTAPDLHLGHTVVLNKLRQFQDAGHKAVLIIGDYTAMIGDPSGRSQTRPPLGPDDIEKNAKTYLAQASKILATSSKKLEVVKNADWLQNLFKNNHPSEAINSLMAHFTVQQLIEREDFSNRLKEGLPLSLLELLYPILQGFDSYKVNADIELGGTDQLFNMLMGREIQKHFGQEPQIVMTLPLLEGTDGVRKMSKSYGNTVALNDAPADMFGKLMSIPDDLMWKYYELLTEEDVATAKAGHPMEAKKKLAGLITARYHGAAASEAARAGFEKQFSKRETPDEVPEHRVSASPIGLADLLVEAGLAPSKNEARRLLKQGAVEVAGERVSDDRPLTVHSPLLLKVGKRQFRKILP